MAGTPTREQYIRRAKRFRRVMNLMTMLRQFGRKTSITGEERFIETDFGRVRTLWYGFDNPAKTPVYFDLHGGGFILGTADMDDATNAALQRQLGCKIISIEYAKAPEFPFPAGVNQSYAVVKHVFENADRYAIDRDRMGIGGHSAGGNISTVLCMKAQVEGQFRFLCQMLDYPPLDLGTSALDKPRPEGAIPPEVAMMFDACYVDPSQVKDPYVSPVYATEETLRGLPPALVIVAGYDSLHDEGVKYVRLLEDAGVVTELHDYPDAGHGFTLNPSPDATDAWAKITAFLRRYLVEAAA